MGKESCYLNTLGPWLCSLLPLQQQHWLQLHGEGFMKVRSGEDSGN